jgi:hypothetical protein
LASRLDEHNARLTKRADAEAAALKAALDGLARAATQQVRAAA